MATNRTPVSLCSWALLLVLLLIVVSVAESRTLAVESAPTCDSVYGAEQGDTCVGVATEFGLSAAFFSAINPNINCNSIFVGQWLCISGSA